MKNFRQQRWKHDNGRLVPASCQTDMQASSCTLTVLPNITVSQHVARVPASSVAPAYQCPTTSHHIASHGHLLYGPQAALLLTPLLNLLRGQMQQLAEFEDQIAERVAPAYLACGFMGLPGFWEPQMIGPVSVLRLPLF